MIEEAVKVCTRCGETKPLSAFVKDKRASDGRGPHCKACDVERVMAKQREAEYATLRYDYDLVEAEHRQTVRDASLEILAAGRRAKENIVTMGQKLIDVKAILPDWTFTDWLTKEFELSDRMAQNMMNVARQYGERPEIISVLNDTVLYLLSAPSTPEAARIEVEEMAVTLGKSPKVAAVKRIVKAHKPEPEPEVIDSLEDLPHFDQYELRRHLVVPSYNIPRQFKDADVAVLVVPKELATKLHMAVAVHAFTRYLTIAEQDELRAALEAAIP